MVVIIVVVVVLFNVVTGILIIVIVVHVVLFEDAKRRVLVQMVQVAVATDGADGHVVACAIAQSAAAGASAAAADRDCRCRHWLRQQRSWVSGGSRSIGAGVAGVGRQQPVVVHGEAIVGCYSSLYRGLCAGSLL